MSRRPHPFAVTAAAVFVVYAGILALFGQRLAAVCLAVLAAAALALFWHIPYLTDPGGRDDVMALADATREEQPAVSGADFAEWEREVRSL